MDFVGDVLYLHVTTWTITLYRIMLSGYIGDEFIWNDGWYTFDDLSAQTANTA
jgi:hypothetical protein